MSFVLSVIASSAAGLENRTNAVDSGLIPPMPAQKPALPRDSVKKPASSKSFSKPDTAAQKKHQDLTDTVHYEADKIDYDAAKKALRLCGHSRVKYQHMQLIADTILYSTGDNLFTATGSPELIEDEDTTIGDFMAYNIKSKRGRVRYATTHVQGDYFSGQRIIKSQANELFVNQGQYTTCGVVDSPHYYFYGEHIRLIPNDKIISKPAVLNIGEAPVAALPYFIFPADRNKKSGILTPVWGGNPAGGGYIDHVGYYFTPNDYYDLLTCFRIQDFSQFMAEASSRYSVRYQLNGSISTRYTFNTDFLSSQRQWAIDFTHNQILTPDGLTQLTGHGSLVSTSDFYSSYSQDSAELQQQLVTSNLSLSHTFKDINASGSITWNRSQDLKNSHISQDLPSANFSFSDRPLIAPPGSDVIVGPAGADTTSHWYNNIYWGGSARGVVHEEQYNDNLNNSFIRPGVNGEFHMSAPQKVFKYITISPNVSANVSGFYGYMDVAARDTSYRHDTLWRDTLQHLSDTTESIFHNYHFVRADTVVRYPLDSSRGDTVYHVIMAKNFPDTIYLHDTIGVRDSLQRAINPQGWNKNPFITDFGWRAGVNMSTNLYGILPLHILNFEGIRHTLTPTVSYTYVPKHILRESFYPIGIPFEGGHERQQLFTLNLANQFDGKVLKSTDSATGKPAESKFSILSANLSTQYNSEATGRKWSDLALGASTGYGFLGVSHSSDFWLYKWGDSSHITTPILRTYSFSLSTGSFSLHGKLWDGDRLLFDSLRAPNPLMDPNAGPQVWHFSVSPAYSYSATRDKPGDVFIPSKRYNLSASADLAFTRNWRVSWSGNYDFMTNQMVQNSINLSCDLECWDMHFQWRPEKLNPGYYFIINVKKIPELKWEQRNQE